MSNPYRKKIDKIHSKIDKLASKGKDNILEWYKYVDEVVNNGDYSALEEVLYIYYNIDTFNNQNSESIKKNTWVDIVFQTKSGFLDKLSKIYKQKGVYQQSIDIYSESTSDVLGSIKEITSWSNNTQYYVKSNQYAKIIGEKITDLEVFKIDATSSVIVNQVNPNMSEEQNLLNKYKISIDILIS